MSDRKIQTIRLGAVFSPEKGYSHSIIFLRDTMRIKLFMVIRVVSYTCSNVSKKGPLVGDVLCIAKELVTVEDWR